MKSNKTNPNVARIILISLFSFLAGCEDFLDKQPLDSLSSATFWKTEKDAMLALTGVYYLETLNVPNTQKQIYSFWNQDTHLRLLEATTDNGFEKDDVVTDFNNGDMASSLGVISELWRNTYLKIAKCNNFLENIDAVEMDEAKKATMKAEVMVIRAFDYFNLSFYWGDVPLVTTVLSVDEANNATRTPKSEVVAFVSNELQTALANLPVIRPDNERGRMTKGAALAILGRLQMAEHLWPEAKATYKQIIDLGAYSIDPRFKELFQESGETSNEVIMTSVRMQDVYGTSMPLSCLGFTWGGFHHFSPYNELVEDFECIDGKPINESPLYNVDNPYVNRDPRLLASFFVDRVTRFKNVLYVSHPDSSATVYPDQLTRRPWSGYALKKFADEGFSGNVRSYGGDFVMVRYAEVLLSYLEANIETGSVTQSVLDETINLVRGRAAVGMPPVTETDISKLTTILRRERRVELAWEGLRLYDLFRWRIAHINLRSRVHGMKLCTKAQAPSYTKFVVNENGYYFCEETYFRENVDYLWPVPQSERDINPKLTQNPGYSGGS
ncbi:MAG TPA: RagB/SusD family nutrient uptake outer membrane protein [Chryseolinea sp.]|nr:RagB/SusD family nutrient uptake outer membrane protein [Chryseolinea sp.]